MKYWMMMLALVAVLSGCSYSEGMKEKEVKGQFKLQVMGYMSETDELHPDAIFQYSNKYRTVYMVVLDTAKQGLTLAEYGTLISNRITTSLEDSTLLLIDTISAINGANALEYEIQGVITNERVWYKLAVVEGKDKYYQVLGWTIMQRKDKYDQDIEAMVRSFTLE